MAAVGRKHLRVAITRVIYFSIIPTTAAAAADLFKYVHRDINLITRC